MRLVVIGGVAAGLSAAARARRINRSLEIVVLEKGNLVSYGACGLPYFVEGRVDSIANLVTYTPEYMARERNIDVRTGAEVVAISHPRREVVLRGGATLHYDRLVSATGARAEKPPPSSRGNVFTVQTPDDAQRLRDFLETRKPRRGAVIGAGYIGLEMVESLRAHGLAVTLYDANADVLGREEPELTRRILDHLAAFRVDVKLSSRVEPASLDQDLILWCAGMHPNTTLASEAGVELGRTGAIRVTDRMETNLSSVFAAGDCAEATSIVTGRPTWLPLGTTANKMGRIAGASAAGARERFAGIAGTSVVRICGLGVAVTGLSLKQARREGFDPINVRIDARDRPRYFRGKPTSVELIADRGTRRLLGATVIGYSGAAGRINVIATALSARMKVDDFEQLDLAYAPPFATVWDPLLIAAQQLIRLLD